MNTPICDFVQDYASGRPVRLHMPGHKGSPLLGPESLDITEIPGADSLYAPSGIIRESELNARTLFGSWDTLYSAEGSSLCVRAMLYLAALRALEERPGARPLILAGRNAHKSYLTAAALLDLDTCWLMPEGSFSLCRCQLTPQGLERAMEGLNPAAVYVTSPDYLGNTLDVAALAEVTHRRGVPLLVDNAHGAYLSFMGRHPISLGADICCDSAHKTLPVLTGGAYLHIGNAAPGLFRERAREAMAMFGSTSPSYLILQSLDRANQYMAEGYGEKLAQAAGLRSRMERSLSAMGWQTAKSEPLKLTLEPKPYGYTGGQVEAHLRGRGIFCEYADPDWVVMMLSPENGAEDCSRVIAAMEELERREPICTRPPRLGMPERVTSVREALMAPRERVAAGKALGRVAAGLPVSCPPAVAPAVPGERMTGEALAIYDYYGITEVDILKQP